MLKNDKWIVGQGRDGMIDPIVPRLIRQEGDRPVISYGVSSFGFDIRLSPKEFLVFRHIPGTVVNPKRFNPKNLEPVELMEDEDGKYFILPAHSYGLGVAVECLQVPKNITIICLGKSTYARCGIIVNCTPAESKWKGHLTLEFSNASGADTRLYTHEGIAQLLFLEGEDCETTYSDRKGKYQDQPEQVVLARV